MGLVQLQLGLLLSNLVFTRSTLSRQCETNSVGNLLSSPALSQVLLGACPFLRHICLARHSYETGLAGSCQTPPKHQRLVLFKYCEWNAPEYSHFPIVCFPVLLADGRSHLEISPPGKVEVKEKEMSTVRKDNNPSQLEIDKLH